MLFFLLSLLYLTALSLYSPTDGKLDYLPLDSPNTFAFYHNAKQPFDHNEQITAIVIVIHGNARNANTYYNYMQTTLNAYFPNATANSVYVIAPWFPIQEDIAKHSSIKTHSIIYWPNSGPWKDGSESVKLNGNKYSSFTCLDKLFEKCLEIFPNLRTIQIAGHSAGGQTVVRYALTNRFEKKLTNQIQMYYTVANPSGFPYLSNLRPVLDPSPQCDYCVNSTILQTNYRFEVPSDSAIANCPDYNDWKFGLGGTPDQLPPYFRNEDQSKMIEDFYKRKVYYLNGEADVCNSDLAKNCNHCKDTDMEKGCEAELQGYCRLQRGVIWYQYVKFMNPIAKDYQSYASVPNIAHDPQGIFNSKQGQQALFSQIRTLKK